MTSTITTSSPEETLKLGARVGVLVPDGAILELKSDLGGGKTTFVQGLARGLGYEGAVASPTFTLSRKYDLPNGRELYHFDLYRLAGTDIVTTELEEIAGTPATITAIEWPETAPLKLEHGSLSIEITPSGESSRTFVFSAESEWAAKVVAEVAS